VAKATVLVGTAAIAFVMIPLGRSHLVFCSQVRVLLLLAGLWVAWMKTSPCIKMIQGYGGWNF